MLADFLAQSARVPFRYGRSDCCLWVADWLIAQGRPDPAEGFRGRYRTKLGCARLLRKHGGVLVILTGCAERAGLSPTGAPAAGDVGVVEVMTPDGPGLSGAIYTGRRWATRAVHGLLVSEAVAVAAWRI